jgi:hypothetical protein
MRRLLLALPLAAAVPLDGQQPARPHVDVPSIARPEDVATLDGPIPPEYLPGS